MLNDFHQLPFLVFIYKCIAIICHYCSLGGGPAMTPPDNEAYDICNTVGKEKIVGFGDDLESVVILNP